MELNVWKKNYTNILTLSALLWRIFLLLLVTLGVSYNVSSTSLNQLHNATSGQSYNIPLRNGGYQITFIFKKTSEMSKGSISVQAEGKQIIGNLDGSGFSDARPSFSIERTVVVSDGELNIEYSSPVAKLAFFLKETEASSGPIDNSAPVVQLIQPSDATYIEGDDITLVAEVSDSDGRVTKASFWVDGEQVNEQSLSIERGYVTYTWPAVSAGVYQVQARVQDDQGETSTSSVLAYKIGNGDGSSSSPEAPDEPGTPPPPTAEEGEPGLRYAYYVGEWSSLPDFDQLTPTSQGVLPNFAFTPAIGKLYTMGFVYEGYLLVEQAGEYTFYVNANDGSNFYLDGEEIINNDGRKDEALEKSGRVQLSAGYHPIRLTFFERWGPQVLEVRYQGPGVSLQSIPDNKLFLNAPEDEIGTSEPVVIPNNPPVVNAGSDIKITLPQSEVSLQADASDEDGTIVSYQWSTVSGNSVAIANPNSAQTSVTDLEEGTYYFAIRVEDDDEDTATDTVKVIVEPAPNIAPSVDAGNDIEITLPQTEVVLSATATDEGGTITSYQWSTVSDGSVTINNPTSAQTEVTNLQEGVYQFVVTVTDNRAATASDTVEVVVKTAPIVENKEPRLNYAYYEGEWSNMPDFNQITAVESGTVANFDISNRQRDEYFGFAFTGYIDIQTAGTYRFYTTSDDGSALYIDGKKVVDNDGRHSRQERSGSVRLSKGKYPIRVVFFEHAGHEVLEVHYQGPGIDKMLIPDEVLSLEGDPVSDVPVIEEDNLIYVNFHRQGRDEAEGWNNVNRSEQSLLLENADGTSSYATLKLETNWGGDNHKGFTTGNNTGKYADAVTRSYFWTQEREIITLEDLSTNKQYSFTFFASSMFGGNRTTVYTIGDQEVTMNASYNEEETVTIEDVRPTADGTIEIEVSRAIDATYGFLGAMIIRSEQAEEVPSTPMADLFQINFHRQGRDEAEGWNNVNRSEQSLLLENADGTSSYATLKLETNWGGDNHKGFTTGNNTGKYADAVTRSYFWTQEREIITLEGASTNKLYNFTFFASSMFSGNRTTIYKIGDQEVSMNASYNEEEVVTIENVRPADDGTIQIEVSRAVGATYGFLGAMIIRSETTTEAPPAPVARKETTEKKGTELAAEVEEVVPLIEQPEVNIYPNPSIGLIHIRAEQARAYQVRNLQGHLIEQGQLSGYQTTSVDFSELPKGIYLVQTQNSTGWNTQRVVIQ